MQFLDNSKSLWKIWVANLRASIVAEMEFRANFLLGTGRQFAWAVTFIFFIEIIFQSTQSLSGWNKAGVILILGLSRLIEGLIDTFYSRNFLQLPQIVQQGKFDFFLTKPLPVQLYTAFRRSSLDYIGNITIGIGLIIYSLFLNNSLPTFSTWILFVIAVFLGLAIYYALLLATSSLVFFIERLEALYAFSTLFSEPLTVPFDVFPYGVRQALTYLLPLAFVVFIPAQTLTNRLVWWEIPVGIGITALFLLLANLLWRAGIRRYSSASS